MPELGTFGSVRGVPGNGYPYRNPRCKPVAGATKTAAAVDPAFALDGASSHCRALSPLLG
jgi:hypothetical protein